MNNIIRGIDISHNNDGIDLANLPNDIAFVSLKATQGATFKDPKFQDWYHLLKAKRPDIIRIPYHFFSWVQSGESQADNLLSCGIDFCQPYTAPLMLDLEADGEIGDASEAIAKVNAFIARYREKQPQQKLIIYSFNSFIKDQLKGHTWPDTVLWIASYQNTPPPVIPGWPYKIWQYSQYGHLNGEVTGGYQDLDRWMGSMDELKELANIK